MTCAINQMMTLYENSKVSLTPQERERAAAIATELQRRAASKPAWTPQPGPQTAAYNSDADVIGYGGAAGGGKTDLLLGLAGTKHTRAIIFRREFPRLEGIEARSREIFNATEDSRQKDRYNESLHRWELSTGATVRFAAMQYEDDKKNYQGRPYDFHGFDEVTEFTESQVRFVTAWNRSTKAGQRCRVVMTFNPPMDEAGEWVTRYFAPWLDKQHARPALDGELRWYAMVDGKEIECAGPEPFDHKGEVITPKSRTFYHAGLADNPILANTGYGDTINALPEPLRSLLKGNFDAAKIVDPWQAIPAEWVRLAQARWENTPRPDSSYVVGADPARGGGDNMAIARLYSGTWFAPIETFPGAAVPDGPSAAALLANDIAAGASIGVDVIGIGSSVYDSLKDNGAVVHPINFGAGAQGQTDKSGRLKFRNVRAAGYWKLREALDPDHGAGLCLPPDPELLADLCAPKYELKPSGIQLEEKEGIKARLGRSPDKADAVVLAWWASLYSMTDLIAW